MNKLQAKPFIILGLLFCLRVNLHHSLKTFATTNSFFLQGAPVFSSIHLHVRSQKAPFVILGGQPLNFFQVKQTELCEMFETRDTTFSWT